MHTYSPLLPSSSPQSARHSPRARPSPPYSFAAPHGVPLSDAAAPSLASRGGSAVAEPSKSRNGLTQTYELHGQLAHGPPSALGTRRAGRASLVSPTPRRRVFA